MNQKQRAAGMTVISNSALVILKVVMGLITHSISILSEAVHSGMDLLSGLITLITVTKSSQPADRSHQYGHGKFESISGMVEAGLVVVAAIYIIWEAGERFLHPRPLQSLHYGMLVMAISSVGNFFVYRHNIKVAKRTESIALEANAYHLIADFYTSLGVLGGLVLIALTQVQALDSLVAIVVALFILKASVNLMGKAFRDLTDRVLPEDEERSIRKIILDHYSQFVEFHKLRTRKSGSERYIDLHLVVAKDTELEAAHNLTHHIAEDLRNRFPSSQTIIHLEPCDRDCQECREKCAQEGSPP